MNRSISQSLWNDFVTRFEETNKNTPVIASVLRQTTLLEIEEDVFVLGCDNTGMKLYLERKRQVLEKEAEVFFKKPLTLTFLVREKKGKIETPLLKFKPTLDDTYVRAGLHPKYSFDNFAVSPTNNVAFAAAQAVAASPGSSYNPLFFYGGVGVGKTHLAQAVVRAILEKEPEKKALFCPGDRFTNEFIESLQDKSAPKFRRKFRSLSVLVLDDIQFIAGKQAVQEEVFHTFNSIVSSGGQIILTSDRPPSDIKNLEDRLRSRFSGGLIVDFQPPDFELRSAITLIKARERGIGITVDAAKIVAEQVTDSRALEGALLSVFARVLGKKEGIDLEDVDQFFQQKIEVKKSRVTPNDIIHAVCSYYNVKPSHIKSPLRAEHVSFPRQVIMYLLRKELQMKYEEIAFILKRKDHTTVMHGYDKVGARSMKDPSFRLEIDRIISSLTAST